MDHNWKTIIPSNDPAHLVRGTEIEYSIPDGFHSRFALYSVRTSQRVKDADHWQGGYISYDLRYRVRDAALITDAETREGKRPPIACEFATLDECEAWIKDHAS